MARRSRKTAAAAAAVARRRVAAGGGGAVGPLRRLVGQAALAVALMLCLLPAAVLFASGAYCTLRMEMPVL